MIIVDASLVVVTRSSYACRRESVYLANVVENWEGGELHRDFQATGTQIISKKSTEIDHRTYVDGEEWAGAISATHLPDHGSKDTTPGGSKNPEPTRKRVPVSSDHIKEESDASISENRNLYKEQPGDLTHETKSPGHPNNNDDYQEGFHGDLMDDSQEYVYEDSINVSDLGSDANKEYEEGSEDDADSMFDQETRQALERLQKCSTISCIQESHKKLKGKTKFNAPHFFLIGFQKCATTSVNHYLRGHPEYLPSILKEAHYFTACQKSWNDTNCKANNTKDYIQNFLRIQDAAEDGLLSATVDASVDYAWKGEELAREIRKVFPWLKIVVMMREPISRVISYTRMWTQKGIRVSTHKDNRIACDKNEELFDCLYPHLTPSAYTGHYAIPLEGWLKVWPARQIHVIQFEEFVENTDVVMRRLKEFLGMDPTLPENVQLYNVNTRKDSGGSPMKRRQYRTLVEMARPDSEKVATLLQKYRLFNKDAWMKRWEDVWDQTLKSCNASRICMVNSN